jgi:hypothetical protein
MYMNLQEYQHDSNEYYFKLFVQIIWLIPNLYGFIQICFELFEYKHTAGQLHIAALPDIRTLPHCCILPHILCFDVWMPAGVGSYS